MKTTKQKLHKRQRDRSIWSVGSKIRSEQRALRKPAIVSAPSPVYTTHSGKSFRFNDHVCVEMLMGVPDEKRTGRLVQVRKGCGQFGSSVYLIRLRDGSLMSFENAMIRHADDEGFVTAFYRSNGRIPPVIPPQPPHEGDTETTEYTLKNKWPETGFVVEKPAQPETPGCFTMTITHTKR